MQAASIMCVHRPYFLKNTTTICVHPAIPKSERSSPLLSRLAPLAVPACPVSML
jgi:hypothetical protein